MLKVKCFTWTKFLDVDRGERAQFTIEWEINQWLTENKPSMVWKVTQSESRTELTVLVWYKPNLPTNPKQQPSIEELMSND